MTEVALSWVQGYMDWWDRQPMLVRVTAVPAILFLYIALGLVLPAFILIDGIAAMFSTMLRSVV